MKRLGASLGAVARQALDVTAGDLIIIVTFSKLPTITFLNWLAPVVGPRKADLDRMISITIDDDLTTITIRWELIDSPLFRD